MDFGTGCLKVTPAHDMNDAKLGLKHNLEIIDILNDDGTLNEKAQVFIGEDRLVARKKVVEKWANKLGTTILLKGPTDVISNAEVTKLNDIHNPSMTVGGTGDVLAGIIGSLISKDVEPFNAARIGAFINGTAGNIAFEKNSYGMIATDIIDNIPAVLKNYL